MEHSVSALQIGVLANVNGMRRATRRELYALVQIGVGESPRYREANLDAQRLRSTLVIESVVVARLANRRVSEPCGNDVKHSADAHRDLRAGKLLVRKSEQQGRDGHYIACRLHMGDALREFVMPNDLA